MNYLAKKQRVLFITGENRLGNGPASMLTGDEIYLIWGVAMPVVLRQYNSGFRFIGGVNVEGMMDSEMWKDIDVDTLVKLALY